MGRIALIVLLILPAAGCGGFQPEPDESPMGPYTSWEAYRAFLKSVYGADLG
ncbi:MAG: hypothetical protein ACQET7_11160 [Thermodesulfobacteriota bacterium]